MHLKYKSGSSWIDYNLVVYPVGAYYFSSNSTSPSTLFGGTWTAVTGRFLYMNAGTSTGGSNTHTLTVNEIPSHRHQLSNWHAVSQQPGYLTAHAVSKDLDDNYPCANKVLATGGGQPHNNMPAYQTVYAWRRTA